MTKDHQVKLDGLEFSVGSSFETRPSTNKWASSSRKPGASSKDDHKAGNRPRKRGIQSKPSR